MPTNHPFRDHLRNHLDLVTTYEEKRAGFLALALEKSTRMVPFINEAKMLRQSARYAKVPSDLLLLPSIQHAFLKAAGVSDKAEVFLNKTDIENAKKELIKNFLEPSGTNFVDELVYRFLLTQGDALGGIMRNVGGMWGKIKFLELLRAAFRNSSVAYEILLRESRTWQNNNISTILSEEIKAIRWQSNNISLFPAEFRTLVVDFTVKIVRKNVDVCLIRGTRDKLSDSYYQDPKNYISLGEVKGGIDPAGADEHWKTGNTALQRIRDAFSQKGFYPQTFFVGAAIEISMAAEIWGQLNRGILSNAANLTKASHMEALCLWILTL
jgi:type II restriction enzyme